MKKRIARGVELAVVLCTGLVYAAGEGASKSAISQLNSATETTNTTKTAKSKAVWSPMPGGPGHTGGGGHANPGSGGGTGGHMGPGGPGGHTGPGGPGGHMGPGGPGGHMGPGGPGGHMGPGGPGGHMGPGGPSHPPMPVDTSRARREGERDGRYEGERDGRSRGRSDGESEGRRSGDSKGQTEGYNAGLSEGKSAGMQVDQTAALQKGSADGQTAGVANGREKGAQRCYDAGYAATYQKSYDEAKKLGLQDPDSYNQGYAKGKEEANRIETEKGTNAGYENGFKQREAEIVGSFPSAQLVAATTVRKAAKTWGPMRGGFFTTPEERMAYDRAYRSAYDESYHFEYKREHDYAYDEAYRRAYQSSYNTYRQSGYQDGYTAGKDEAYQDAYKTAYNTQYNLAYTTEYNKEYADSRARGQQTGMTEGKTAGFNDGKAEYYKAAYDKGYQEVAAVAYPDAFNSGKQTGIAAAEKFYKENAVLEAADAVLHDENGNGKFEADENILMKVAVRNLGFKASKKITVSVVSEKNVVAFEKELTIDSLAARDKTSVDLKLGGLAETAAAGADKLVIKFTEADGTKAFSQQEKTYAIVNNATIGVITAEDAVVRKSPVPLLGKKLAELRRGDKVVILAKAQMGFYKVRKPKASQGEWTEGYVPIKKVVVQ